MAGAGSRPGRSPEAPKITSVQGGRISSSVRTSWIAGNSIGGSTTAAELIAASLEECLLAKRRDGTQFFFRNRPHAWREASRRSCAESSRDPDRLLFFHERLQEGVVGVGELLDPFVLELAEDLLLVDGNLGEALECVARAGQVVVNPNLWISVVPVGVERLRRHGIYRIGGDQRLDVVELGVGGILRGGRRPERPLRGDARRFQGRETPSAEDFLVGLIGEPGITDRELAAQRLGARANLLGNPGVFCGGVELLVGVAVHAADEEAGDRPNFRNVLLASDTLLHRREERLHDLPVSRN